MNLELKPGQQQLLERAAQAGMSPEDVIDQAFAVIQSQYDQADWMLEQRESIAVHIEEGFLQAERGELIDGGDVAGILDERHARRPA
ncbi:MAG TPA: hypothetical protein VE291_06435 [Terracidiphilus sp.]|jgi:iron-sulfur cluster repair protein YtfE (RIC family)|nr:hypothetical protein [Terracidiphilus sp.]